MPNPLKRFRIHTHRAALSFPDDVLVTLTWQRPASEVSFWLTPKERKQLRKVLKDV